MLRPVEEEATSIARSAVLALAVFCTLQPAACDVAVIPQNGTIRVTIDGKLFTEYHHADCENPYLYPVIGPHGIPMTRNYPMRDVPGEAHDHPHHTSIWFGHDGVNGVDFWRTANPGHGRVVQQQVLRVATRSDRGVLETANQWVAADGTVVCHDRRKLSFHIVPAGRAIDWVITIEADEGAVTFGDTEEGTMAIRTHPNLRLENGDGVTTASGQALNSEGVRGKDVWGKRAAWIDYWGRIDGHTVGVALFDHPQNVRHPTWWHARPYGLFTANPFGVADFEGKPRGTGDLAIPAGESLTLRYRFVIHEGDPGQAGIADEYERYSKH